MVSYLIRLNSRPHLPYRTYVWWLVILPGLLHILAQSTPNMWVTFCIGQTSSQHVVFKSYQVQSGPSTDRPRHVSSAHLIDTVMKEASIGREQLLQMESVKVHLSLPALKQVNLEPMRYGRFAQETTAEMSIIMKIIEEQQ